MFKLFSKRPDHPMFDLDEARRLLGELPDDDIPKALEDITFWLDSIKNAAGFSPELRNTTIMLLDEAGQRRHAELLHRYLSAPHLRDFQGLHLWQGMHAFAQALSEAYSANLDEYQRTSKKNREFKDRLPLVCVRQLRAVSELMKLDMMRYIQVEPQVWHNLSLGYRFAESEQCAESMVLPYAGNVIHTSPQRELLRALVMHISSTETLAADQIEVSYRIAARLTSFFDLKATADPACAYVFDLAANAPPHSVSPDQQLTPDIRMFSATRAVPPLKNICDQNENDPVWQERRSSSEFTPAGKLTVLKHLMSYWDATPPHRHSERRVIKASLSVTHGFRVITHLVKHIDAGHVAGEDADAAAKRDKIDLTALDDIDYSTEEWSITDMNAGGFGASLTGSSLGTWIKIGDLCGLKPPNGELWWVGVIRRLHTNVDNKIHVGIELLAKHPASVWLRILGKGKELVSNWETSSGTFSYDYLPVILLPDAQNSYLKATMLMESGGFVADALYQVMMGEHSRDIKLTKLLAEGEDYEQVSFEWLP